MKLTIGVVGASGGLLPADVCGKAYRLGEAVAEHDAVLITGACPALPHEAARGAKAKGGLVVGISPGLSVEEHRGRYRTLLELARVPTLVPRLGHRPEPRWSER